MELVSRRRIRQRIRDVAPRDVPISKELVEALATYLNDKYGNDVDKELENLVGRVLEAYERHNAVLAKWGAAPRKRLRKAFLEDVLEKEERT